MIATTNLFNRINATIKEPAGAYRELVGVGSHSVPGRRKGADEAMRAYDRIEGWAFPT